MSLNLKMLIIVNMECPTETELGFGITLQLGNQNHCVRKIVATLGIINILKLRNAYHQKLRQNGETIHKQEDLYKIPSGLIVEILMSLVD